MVAEQLLVIDWMKGIFRSPASRCEPIDASVCRRLCQLRRCSDLEQSRHVASYAPPLAAKDKAVAEHLLAASEQVRRSGCRRIAVWLDFGEARERRR